MHILILTEQNIPIIVFGDQSFVYLILRRILKFRFRFFVDFDEGAIF